MNLDDDDSVTAWVQVGKSDHLRPMLVTPPMARKIIDLTLTSLERPTDDRA